MKKLPLLSFMLLFTIVSYSQSILFPFGSTWKYLDNGSDQTTSWRSPAFNDANWATGAAELGYGDGDEVTIVSYGTTPGKKYTTTYFRKSVFITNPAQYAGFLLGVKRDDGVVIYINGTEVYRNNLPSGTITYTTLASNATDDGETILTSAIPASAFVTGGNIVAVEIHQNSKSSTDITFDMELTATNAQGNQNPVASAGTDQSITLPVSSITLAGSGSDTDGTISSYAWTRVSGPTAMSISTPASASTVVSGLTLAGTYVFRLTVTDNLGATASDDVNVIVNNPVNQNPLANAGTDQSITLPASSITLSGSGSDADGTIASYAWTRVSGPTAVSISTPASASTAVSGLTLAGTYVFRLTVVDNAGAAASDDVNIIVNNPVNQNPVASAGTDQSITLPASSITLSGSGSDADGTIASYAWTRVSGPTAVSISTPASASTAVSGLTLAGTYIFRLTVTDNLGATASDDVNIIVNNPVNQNPVASAGTDQSITLPASSITFSGSGSDADGTIASYAWTRLSGPAAVSISTPASASTAVSGLTLAGTYIFRLTVTDNLGATASDDVNVIVNPAVTGSLTLVTWGTSWKYLDNGTNQGTVWTGTSFNDTAWPSGPAELGYGDSPVTTISYGPDPNNKYITYYFRKQVNFTNPSSYASVALNMRRDDGAVVYVNGAEVYRSNLPSGTITYTTLAPNATDDGEAVQTAIIPVTAFVAGTNIVAVEVHQNSKTSSDITFDMELVASTGTAVLTRGPYLQMASETAVTLRWRTDVATNSKIEVGTVFGTYTLSAISATSTTDHEVRITGLAPDTKYFYRFGSNTSTLQATTANYFITAPPVTTTRKIRVAAFGDCGKNLNGVQTNTLSAYQNYTGTNAAELMLLLGDNAYESGTDANYQTGFFNAYSSSVLKNHILFPTPGNHEYDNALARQIDKNIDYYNIFTVPKSAECGGVASGTESYYSYNWGNIHFISLDSYGMETANNLRLYDTLSPQVTWIKQDLAANTQKWTVVYWHHPPFTMGSHNSDNESELASIRQNFIRILERFGVDMVLCGHSHDYERSYLLKGYYSDESSFNLATHAVTSSSGKYNGSANSCAWQTTSSKVNHGTVYVVSGSAGGVSGVQTGYPHNAMPFSLDDGGMFYFEVEDNRMDAKFIRMDGVIADQFTIMKDVAKTSTVTINAGQSTTLTASWKGTYNWSTGATTRSIMVSPTTNTTYICTDGISCIADHFTVTVGSGARMQASHESESSEMLMYSVFPVPVKRGEIVHIESTSNNPFVISVMNATGTVVRQLTVDQTVELSTADLAAGLYYIHNHSDLRSKTKKFVVLE